MVWCRYSRRLHGYIVLSICSIKLCIVLDILSQSQSSDVGEIFSRIRVTVTCQTSRMEHKVGCLYDRLCHVVISFRELA